jgi:transcriptional regulator GlxA family with amidase domain
VSPKQFARTARLHRTVDLLQRGASSGLADAALRAGYFDQAHMSRDFHDLAGVTPRMAAAAVGSIRPILSIFGVP